MTKLQVLTLVSAALGVGFVGGGAVSFRTDSDSAAITWTHALRIEAALLPDGGLSPDRTTAYRTRVVVFEDGGLDTDDLGPVDCDANTTPVRTWVNNNCAQSDGGVPRNVRVIEVRPTESDDGGTVKVGIEVYGDVVSRCIANKTPAVRTFVSNLDCGARPKRRSNPSPL